MNIKLFAFVTYIRIYVKLSILNLCNDDVWFAWNGNEKNKKKKPFVSKLWRKHIPWIQAYRKHQMPNERRTYQIKNEENEAMKHVGSEKKYSFFFCFQIQRIENVFFFASFWFMLTEIDGNSANLQSGFLFLILESDNLVKNHFVPLCMDLKVFQKYAQSQIKMTTTKLKAAHKLNTVK